MNNLDIISLNINGLNNCIKKKSLPTIKEIKGKHAAAPRKPLDETRALKANK